MKTVKDLFSEEELKRDKELFIETFKYDIYGGESFFMCFSLFLLSGEDGFYEKWDIAKTNKNIETVIIHLINSLDHTGNELLEEYKKSLLENMGAVSFCSLLMACERLEGFESLDNVPIYPNNVCAFGQDFIYTEWQDVPLDMKEFSNLYVDFVQRNNNFQ